MSDQTNVGPPPDPAGDPPARDAARTDPATAPRFAVNRTMAPPGETVDNNTGGHTAAAPSEQSTVAPGLPELSIGAGATSARSRSEPEPPKLDGYDVVAHIGEGGMGTVWRGVQLSTRRNVALKLISAAGFGSERARQRFDREVEITARLEHPNIARVYDSGINRGVYFYAMELIEGEPLDQYILRHHPTRPNVLRLFAIICRAVDHAHQRGVIHRDLKPGNILVSADGQPHVLDFGLAKALQQAGKEAGISIDGEVAGTPGFMAPEQAAGKLDVDARCDVYSLGVILYRLLTGRTPHDLTGSYLDVLRRISEEEPRRPRQVDRSMDRELEALLLHAMQRDQAQRYKTAGELAQDIENYLAGDPLTAKPPSTIYFLRKRVRKHRVKLAAMGIVVGLAFIVTMLAVFLRKSQQETHEKQQRVVDESKGKENERLEKEKAKGNAAVTKGTSDFDAGRWKDARDSYLEALTHFANAHSSTLTADLGLWDVNRMSPEPILTFAAAAKGEGRAVNIGVTSGALVFLGDGRRALGGCDDGTLRMWDVTSGRVLRVIPASRTAVRSVGASADGLSALSAGADGALTLWNLASGMLVKEFPRLATGTPKRVALSGDAVYALSASGGSPDALQAASDNDSLTLWNVANASRLATDRTAGILDVKGNVTQALFSPDSLKLLTVGGEIVVWNVVDGKRLATLPNTAMIAAFSPDGQWIAAGSSAGDVHLLNVATHESSQLKGTGNAISAIWFDANKDQVITASEYGAFHATDLHGKELWSLPGIGEINAVAISPGARVALTAADPDKAGNGLSVWRLAPPPEVREGSDSGPFPNVAVSRDGRITLSRGSGRSTPGVVLRDTATGNVITPANFPADHCTGCALSTDGRMIARFTGSALSVWSLDPPQEVQRIKLLLPGWSESTAVAISGDGTKVALAAGNSILVYRMAGASAPQKLTGHGAAVTSLSFSGDGRLLLSGSEDQTARIWNVESAQPPIILQGHTAAVNTVAISDDGKTAATASGAIFQGEPDNSVRAWEVSSGRQLLKFPQVSGPIRSVAISGDGRLIAAGGDEKTVTIWDRVSGEVLHTIRNLHGPSLSLSFDQTGEALLCGADTLSVWNLGRPAKERSLQQAFMAAGLKVASASQQPADLLAFARWYAFQGEPAWAARFFEQARGAGMPAPALELSRCHWDLGDLDAAERDLNSVTPQEAPAFYVNLCRVAMRRERGGR